MQQSLLKNLDDADAALLAQARLSRDVQQRLFAIRTVPFASLSERLYRILRADGEGARQARQPGDSRRARRSSIARCWKSSSARSSTCCATRSITASKRATARVAAGKSETGEIALTVRQVGNEIAIELADDGGGIDFDARPRSARSLRPRSRADGEPTDARN